MVVIKKRSNVIPVDFGEFQLNFPVSDGNIQRIDVYKRQMRMRPAQELGIDTFYYSIKAAAREMCAPLQNQIVTTG